MDRVPLFEEYRLIERSETEINGAWKGAHLLLFFMAFVFGSFCTFCFHMLMYLFDEKCVLFPKLLSLTSLRHNVIYEFIPVDKETADMLPLDFLGTQWVEKSACYLPTYVPLLSGIFGLVWTTMFLMCSSGSRTLTGLQRPWRVLPPVFLFSLAMSCLCAYSSAVTHYGLNELCIKLGEITGSSTCTYTVNVATLAYERRIRGVYQAIRLTIFSAWLHTLCWLLSTLLTLARFILVVDFQLVRVNADLIGDIDKMLEYHEEQIHTVSPEIWFNDDKDSNTSLPVHAGQLRFKHKTFIGTQTDNEELYTGRDSKTAISKEDSDVLYVSKFTEHGSVTSILPEEMYKLARTLAYSKIPKDKHFIVKLLYDLLQNISYPDTESSISTTSSFEVSSGDSGTIIRQLGRENISSNNIYVDKTPNKSILVQSNEAKEIARHIRQYLQHKLSQIEELQPRLEKPSTSSDSDYTTKIHKQSFESTLNITDELRQILKDKIDQNLDKVETYSNEKPSEAPGDVTTIKKSNLKHAYSQTEKRRKSLRQQKVKITEPEEEFSTSTETVQDVEKESQTKKPKEKED